jgi:hypothetical protein
MQNDGVCIGARDGARAKFEVMSGPERRRSDEQKRTAVAEAFGSDLGYLHVRFIAGELICDRPSKGFRGLSLTTATGLILSRSRSRAEARTFVSPRRCQLSWLSPFSRLWPALPSGAHIWIATGHFHMRRGMHSGAFDPGNLRVGPT